MRKIFPFNIKHLEKLSTNKNIILEKKDNVYTLGLGLTSRCNLRCPKCYYGSIYKNTETDLPIDGIEKILKNCSKLKAVNLALDTRQK